MNRLALLTPPLLLLLLPFVPRMPSWPVWPGVSAGDWPQWRGANADGTTSETDFPTQWDGSRKIGIRWKVELPGAGNSSPVVRDDDVIVTATSGRDHSELHVLCYDRHTGQLRWRTNLSGSPADPPFRLFPPERGHAASTAVITPKAVVAFFGTGDLICLDRDGKPLWMRSLTKEFGPIRNDYGIASSPIVAEDTVLMQIDHLEGSYLLAADLATGQTRWKADRPGIYDNWSTPVVATIRGSKQVICLGTKTLIAYDLKTGQITAQSGGLERLCSPTPIVRGSVVYAVSGPNGANWAIDLSTSPKPKILWQSKKTGPFIPSAVVVGEYLVVPDDQGLVTCYERATGKELWRERVGGRGRSSLVVVGDRVYWTSLDGTTVVFRPGAEIEILAKNKLGEDVAASPALAHGAIFIRGDKHLWCIGL